MKNEAESNENRGNMLDVVRDNLEQPERLEALFRSDPARVGEALEELYEQDPSNLILRAWHARLQAEEPGRVRLQPTEQRTHLANSLVIALVAFALLKACLLLPSYVRYEYVARNWPLIAMAAVGALSAIRRGRSARELVVPAALLVAGAIYLNLLPHLSKADTNLLSLFHFDFIAWVIVGIVYAGERWRSREAWLPFVRFSGELVAAGGILGAALSVFTAVYFALFSLIGVETADFYIDWIVPAAVAVLPLVGVGMAERLARSSRPLAETVAVVFSPVALITIVSFLIGVIATGKSPFTERDFLAVFNAVSALALLLVVFILATRKRPGDYPAWLAFAVAGLVIGAIVFDATALLAVFWRLTSFGFTPNRTALLGMNILVFANLCVLAVPTVKLALSGAADAQVRTSLIAKARGAAIVLLPAYVAWAAFVTIAFPPIFGFE